jgi:hypothetical protein
MLERWTKTNMAVVEGIELLFAFYFVENGSEWIDLYEILRGEYFYTVLKHASFNLHSFLSLGKKLSNDFLCLLMRSKIIDEVKMELDNP